MARMAVEYVVRSLDARALADAMNARPLDEDCDGGVWTYPGEGITADTCDGCGRNLGGVHMVCSDTHTLCLPCAVKDCERAGADAAQRTTANAGDEQDNVCRECGDHMPCDCDHAAHAAADPHCTCPDCILSHEALEVKP